MSNLNDEERATSYKAGYYFGEVEGVYRILTVLKCLKDPALLLESIETMHEKAKESYQQAQDILSTHENCTPEHCTHDVDPKDIN